MILLSQDVSLTSVKKNIQICILFLLVTQFLTSKTLANNASYIATSGAISKQKHLEVISNNAANVNTNGFEQDNVIFEKRDHSETKRKADSFVIAKGNYRTENLGPLKPTGRVLDMAIVGNAYFMLLTPNGPRYTLDGAAAIDHTNTLVNHNGYPFASKDGQPILFPETYKTMQISEDGTIFADIEEVAIVGMFGFDANAEFAKEGDNMYITNAVGVPVDDGTIKLASGYLRGANISSTKILTEVIELQRSSDTSNELVKNIGLLEKNLITRVMKTN
mgnify:CR=1 FL=1